jgi:uracil-DNA glycosylase family 4
MSDSNKLDPRLRRHFMSLKRAGLNYVAAHRFAVPLDDLLASTPPVELEGRSGDGDEHADTALVDERREQAPASMTLSTTNKDKALVILADEVAQCVRCPELVASRSRTVFGDGGSEADICFVGEAPGAEEDAQGVPFVGRAGQLLTDMIVKGLKMSRQDVYICNVIKCRPEGNRNPTWQEMVNCQTHLERQLEIVKPKVIVALGKHSTAFLMGRKPEQTPIGKLRGSWTEYRGIPVMPTWHPAYILRGGPNPPSKREFWSDMKEVMRKIGRALD